MPDLAIDPNLLNLLKSLQPFLPERGRKASALAYSVGELLATESAQNTLRHFRNLRVSSRVLPMTASSSGQHLDQGSPFLLFLILILLLLSGWHGHQPAVSPGAEEGLLGTTTPVTDSTTG